MYCKCELALRFAKALNEFEDYLSVEHSFDLDVLPDENLLMMCVELEDVIKFMKICEVKEDEN